MTRSATISFFAAMLLAVLALGVGTGHAGSGEGQKIFNAKKCGDCHQTKGPAAEKTIYDVWAKKGPELWYAGSKFKEGFLKKWLADPKPIRPMQFYSLTEKNKGDHPKLSKKDAEEVAEYLMTLKSSDVKTGVIKKPKRSAKARIVFEKKQACYGCHQVKKRGKVSGGLTGPTFIGAAKRLNPDWIYAYLSNPKVFKPVKDMPVYVGILNNADFKALAAYIATMK
ncbi:MAG TPA: c-type cytochrome [Deltaproteobacteria bacterium]|nr:c-type cytochrome [Deltaproteobacteria bacterium]